MLLTGATRNKLNKDTKKKNKEQKYSISFTVPRITTFLLLLIQFNLPSATPRLTRVYSYTCLLLTTVEIPDFHVIPPIKLKNPITRYILTCRLITDDSYSAPV